MRSTRAKLGDGPSVHSFLNPAAAAVVGAVSVWCTEMVLAMREMNPGSIDATRAQMERVAIASGLDRGEVACVVVATDLGIMGNILKLQRDAERAVPGANPLFRLFVPWMGALHVQMHMVKAWRALCCDFTSRAFAKAHGRETEAAIASLASGNTTHHDQEKSFEVERNGILQELAHEYITADTTGARLRASGGGGELLAWLRARAADDETMRYALEVLVFAGGCLTLHHGGVRENDGDAVVAARACFAWVWLVTGHPKYAAAIAHSMAQHARSPPLWRQAALLCAGLGDKATPKGMLQGIDALQEQGCRRLKRHVPPHSTFQSWAFAAKYLPWMERARATIAAWTLRGDRDEQAPRAPVDYSASTASFRATLRATSFFSERAPAEAARPLSGVGGKPLPACAAGVAASGAAAFSALYAATVAHGWQDRVATPAVAYVSHTSAAAKKKKQEERAAMEKAPPADLVSEILQLRQQNAALKRAAVGDEADGEGSGSEAEDGSASGDGSDGDEEAAEGEEEAAGGDESDGRME